MRENIYRLTHHYSLLSGFFGVKTEMMLHAFNVACAYIQLLRDDLPYLQGVEDTIGEDNGSALLARIYGLEVITKSEAVTDEVDFYTNWNLYCGAGLDEFRADFLTQARPNAFSEVIKVMRDECHEAISRLKAEEFEVDDQVSWIATVETNAQRLESVLSGEPIPESWNWKTLHGEACTGRVYVTGGDMNDYPGCLLSN